jgi:hypothetical protein
MNLPKIVICFEPSSSSSYDGPSIGEKITKSDDLSRDMQSPQVMMEQENFKDQVHLEHMPQHLVMALFEKVHNELLRRKRQRINIYS